LHARQRDPQLVEELDQLTVVTLLIGLLSGHVWSIPATRRA
jgi:hypothetical protein